jgi:hypothetical protein
MIENILDYEMGYLFTNDDKDFNTFLCIYLIKYLNQEILNNN